MRFVQQHFRNLCHHHRPQAVPERTCPFTDSCPSQKMHSDLNSSLRLLRTPFPTHVCTPHLSEIQLHLPSVTLSSAAFDTWCVTGSENHSFVQVWLLFKPSNTPTLKVWYCTKQPAWIRKQENQQPSLARSLARSRVSWATLSGTVWLVLLRWCRKLSAPAYMMIRGSGTDSLMDLWGRTLAPFR